MFSCGGLAYSICVVIVSLRFDFPPQRAILSCVFLLVATYPGGMEVGESFKITGHY